jgi:hypothetical protein
VTRDRSIQRGYRTSSWRTLVEFERVRRRRLMPTQQTGTPQVLGNPWQSFEETDGTDELAVPAPLPQWIEPPAHDHEDLIQLVPVFADTLLCAALAVAVALLLQYVNGALW